MLITSDGQPDGYMQVGEAIDVGRLCPGYTLVRVLTGPMAGSTPFYWETRSCLRLHPLEALARIADDGVRRTDD